MRGDMARLLVTVSFYDSTLSSVAHHLYPVITDPDNPAFDLEKLINYAEKKSTAT
mgnify:CR=1 FL=1